MTIETWNYLIQFFTSLIFLGISVAGVFVFKYKHDEYTRKIYIENAKKLYLVFKEIFRHANIDDEHFNMLIEVQSEAMLYLHKDIAQYIVKLRHLVVDLQVLKMQIDATEIKTDKRSELVEQHGERLKAIFALYDDFYKIYRKQILNDGIDWNKCSEFFDEIKSKIEELNND